MRTYLIGYDLNRPGQKYSELFDAIKEIANGWWHHLDSTWLIKTNLSAVEIRDKLSPHIDSGDELLVARLVGEWATYGFNDSASTWLKDHMSYE
jgi:hypothetical protein